MATTGYNPAEAATKVGVSVGTIRNWCEVYAADLSPGANPPKGTARKLSESDIAVFQAIQDWKSQGVESEELLVRLATLEREDLQPYIEGTTTALQAPIEDAPTAILPAPAVAMAEFTGMLDRRMQDILQAVEGVDQRIEERVQAVKEETRREMDERLRQYRVMVVMLGLLCLLLGMAIFLVAQQK